MPLWRLILPAFLVLASCRTVSPSKINSLPVAETRWLNDWSPKEKKLWYNTAQGSHLVPWNIFLALESPRDESLFASRKNLEGYGFVYAPEGNSDSLPLGFIKDSSLLDNKDYLGFNCAACHTGRITHEGRSFLVHGGPASSDLERFVADLDGALKSLDNPEKRQRFNTRMEKMGVKSGSSEFAEELAASSDWVRVTKNDLTAQFPAGPGRLDAVSWILNTVTSTQLGIESNWHKATAPIAYPHLWKAPDLACVQTDCIVSNPITRNVGEVLGVFGRINLKGTPWIHPSVQTLSSFLFKGDLYKSTVKVSNLYDIEESLRLLKAPTWPREFPSIDTALAGQGEKIYQEQCASCHVNIKNGLGPDSLTAANKFDRRLIKVTKVPFRDVGTDSTYMEDHSQKMAKPGPLGPLMALGFSKLKGEGGEYPSIKTLGIATILAAEKYFQSSEFKELARARFPDDRAASAISKMKNEFQNFRAGEEEYDGLSYKARPLDGIAFTAPYLHNGSVLTLAELLEVPANRRKTFLIGDSDYDVEQVGLKSSGAFEFNSDVRGNSNQGHLYGTDLDPLAKRSLLEYLKTL